MPISALIFDIETIRDTDLVLRCGYVAKAGKKLTEAPQTAEFAPLLFHVPCAIAIGRVTTEGVLTAVESLQGLLGATDPGSLTDAFWTEASHTPILISFNGRGFDLPVLELCALRYGIACAKHWQDQYGTRYRYSKVHVDLLDILSNYGGASRGLSLTNLVQLIGYAGKGEVDGSQVQDLYDAGQLDLIRAYNESDVIRTYALWLHWARIAGRLTEGLFHQALQASQPFLDRIRAPLPTPRVTGERSQRGA